MSETIQIAQEDLPAMLRDGRLLPAGLQRLPVPLSPPEASRRRAETRAYRRAALSARLQAPAGSVPCVLRVVQRGVLTFLPGWFPRPLVVDRDGDPVVDPSRLPRAWWRG